GGEWQTKEELAAEFAAADEKNRLDALNFVGDRAVAAWSIDKMRELIAIAQSLVEHKGRPSSVTRFQAGRRSVPRPHTWGEVALIKARLMAGAWYPPQRVWLKVSFGSE